MLQFLKRCGITDLSDFEEQYALAAYKKAVNSGIYSLPPITENMSRIELIDAFINLYCALDKDDNDEPILTQDFYNKLEELGYVRRMV